MIEIIIATIGRHTLKRTLLSIRPQNEHILVTVISDGKQPVAKAITKEVKKKVAYHLRFVKGPKSHNWGNIQRQFGIEQSEADYFLFIDDDDIYTPDAFKSIDKAIKNHPNEPTIFRMLDHNGDRYILWRKRKVALGNIGTPMVLVPNNINRLGDWDTDDYAGDAKFIYDTLRKWPKKKVHWSEDCIVICRPEV